MKVLVTGGAGFVGRHLAAELIRGRHDVAAFDLDFPTPLPEQVERIVGDVRSVGDVRKAVSAAGADACVHLAAVSFVPLGGSAPELMLTVNVLGTVNVLESFMALAPAARILVVSSARVYGESADGSALKEDTPLAPVGLYAISKAAADAAALGYARRHGVAALVARPNNHTGPGQPPQFAVASLVSQVRAVLRGERRPVVSVGNLESEREFMDARDVAVAYRLLLERGEPGLAYNISSHRTVKIRDVLSMIEQIAGVKVAAEVEPGRYRPTDSSPRLDTSRLEAQIGWRPRIPLERTIRDMLAEP